MRRLKGLGDVIELITRFTGIKWLVKKVFGEDCGCEDRKVYLNKKVSFSTPQPLTPPPPTPTVNRKK
tara:strand:+ start:7089 stop:7289 length:201 start_codon:yes stop_codon:yes gene_type:complete